MAVRLDGASYQGEAGKGDEVSKRDELVQALNDADIALSKAYRAMSDAERAWDKAETALVEHDSQEGP